MLRCVIESDSVKVVESDTMSKQPHLVSVHNCMYISAWGVQVGACIRLRILVSSIAIQVFTSVSNESGLCLF